MSPIQKLQASLQASRAQWVADETPLSRLTPAEKARRLGAVVDRAALAAAMAPRAQVAVPKFDPAVDWRNRNGNCHPCKRPGRLWLLYLVQRGGNRGIDGAN